MAAPLALCSRTQSALSLGLAAAAAAASCKHEQLSLPLNRHQASPLPRVPPRNTSRRFMPKARLSTLTRMVAAHQINFSTPRKSTNEYKFTHRIASVHTYRGDCKHSVAQTVGDALASIYTFVWNRMRAGYTASERRLLREERTGGTSAAPISGLHSPRAPSYKVQIELPAAARSSGRIAAAVLVRMRRDARLHAWPALPRPPAYEDAFQACPAYRLVAQLAAAPAHPACSFVSGRRTWLCGHGYSAWKWPLCR